jgi:putative nucleotidyltransferase with HDIG domain
MASSLSKESIAEFFHGYVTLFKGMPMEACLELAQFARALRVRDGHLFFEKGSEGTDLYLIRTGIVEVFLNGHLGFPGRVTLTILSAGDMLGELSATTLGKRTASAIARSDGTSVALAGKDLLRFASRHPDLNARILHEMASITLRSTVTIEQKAEELSHMNERLMVALVQALDLRDSETENHSIRVARFACAIARHMGITGRMLNCIRQGALLHDVGKIGVPDALLLKPDKLANLEMELMREHVHMGHSLVTEIGFPREVRDIVLHHHERWDGSGYPDGLSGEEISIGARIFAVADTIDAMLSDRIYRPAIPIQKVREELRKESGKLFDPKVAFACLDLLTDSFKKAIFREPRSWRLQRRKF